MIQLIELNGLLWLRTNIPSSENKGIIDYNGLLVDKEIAHE